MFRILVVGDDPTFLNLTRACLMQSKDMQVEMTTSPLHGAAMLTENQYDAVISDHEMPEMDGITLLKEVRRHGITVPFIIISDCDQDIVTTDAPNSGAYIYLRSSQDHPAQLTELRSVVFQAIDQLPAELSHQDIFGHKGAATFIVEGDMTLSLVDDKFSDLTGYLREEIEGVMPLTILVDDKDLERLSNYHRDRRLNPASAPSIYKFRLVDRHGAKKDVYIAVMLIPGTDRSVASIIDGSGWKHVEDGVQIAHKKETSALEGANDHQVASTSRYHLMKDNQAILRSVIDSLPDPTFVLDHRRVVRIWNQAIEDITGIRADQIIGSSVEELSKMVPDVNSPLIAEEILSCGKECPAREIYIPSIEDGDGLYLWGKASALYDSQGRLSGAIESLRDITALKRMEAQIRRRVDLERLVSSISAQLVVLDPDNLDATLNETIQTLGESLGADRSYIFHFNNDHTTMDNTHEWCAEDIKPEIVSMQGILTEKFPPGMKEILTGRAIYIPAVSDLPPEAEAERRSLENSGILSIILIPIAKTDDIVGFMGFETTVRDKTWSEDDLALLMIVGNLIGDLIVRISAQKKLKESEERL